MIELAYNEIPGLVSQHALAEHFELYKRYVEADALDSRSAGAELLHEVYFTGLALQGKALEPGPLRALIEATWGHVGRFQSDLTGVAGAVNDGWVVLAHRGNRLRMFELEGHVGPMGWQPILALDMHEHSFWMDFGTRKGAYIDAFIAHLDWATISQRYNSGR